eukprot:scaffold204083_cov17-Tisochrysis_lutea.AAC.1
MQLCPLLLCLQPYEVLRVGMTREFVVVDEEDEYGQTILSLAAMEVRHPLAGRSAKLNVYLMAAPSLCA